MTLSSSMNIAQQALLVNQAAISVVSNNIANVSTEGYSRQAVDLSPEINYTPISNSVLAQALSGSGVDLSSIQRYTDSYLQSYYRQQNSAKTYLDQYATVASNIENTTNELAGSKLEDAFTGFYSAAQTLSSNPDDATARQSYIQQAQTIAIKLNDMSSSLNDVRTGLVGDVTDATSLDKSKISLQVDQVNVILTQLAEVNSDIVKISSDEMQPNSLLDKRDLLINKLSNFLPVNVSEQPCGMVDISINDVSILKGTKLSGALDVTTGDINNPAILQIRNDAGTVISGNINSSINAGSIAALLDVGGSDPSKLTIKGVLDKLDTLANGFAGVMNNLQTAVIDGKTPMAIDKASQTLIVSTEDIFESGSAAPITASNIKVNQLVLDDPYLIAAARVDATTEGTTYKKEEIGNNTNMIAILDTRTNSTPPLNNNPEEYVSTMVGKIGTQVEDINTRLTNQTQVLSTVKTQLTSTTGVSTDQELADLIKYQRAYQASARIFTTCNDLLDVLMNLGK